MYCEKCGSQVLDTDKFCEKCGNNLTGEVKKETEKIINKDEVLLEIKPTTKISCFILPNLVFEFISVFCAIAFMLLVFWWIGSSPEADPMVTRISIMCVLGIGGAVALIWTVMILLSAFLAKKQNQKLVYIFYPDRVVAKDSFLGRAQVEMKYKYIREAGCIQSITQRMFKVGTIKLYSNAEGGAGGLNIKDIEEVENNYQAIKEIIKV